MIFIFAIVVFYNTETSSVQGVLLLKYLGVKIQIIRIFIKDFHQFKLINLFVKLIEIHKMKIIADFYQTISIFSI
ncbi:hypothetical protein [Polaribacter sp. R77954]|uniref:hypothetical protein n=1 Tax=Polaribacter sp. R77954 TaxID=3093870 RepID=UPI0037C57F4E